MINLENGKHYADICEIETENGTEILDGQVIDMTPIANTGTLTQYTQYTVRERNTEKIWLLDSDGDEIVDAKVFTLQQLLDMS